MKKEFKLLALLAIFLMFSLSTGNCKSDSHESVIKRTINRIGDLVEDKKLDSLLSYISDDYSDSKKRTFTDIRDLISRYFERYSAIAVNILATKITNINFPNAITETDAAFSSGAARAFRKIVRYSGEQYRITLKLHFHDNCWHIIAAEWRFVGLDELFPASFKLLKKIFPNSF